MTERIYRCSNNHNPSILRTYAVAGEEKTYAICNSCADLECFNKHVIKEEPLLLDKVSSVGVKQLE